MVFVNVPLPWQQNLAIWTKLPNTGLMKFTPGKIAQILYWNTRFGQFYQMCMPHLCRLKKQHLEYENLAFFSKLAVAMVTKLRNIFD